MTYGNPSGKLRQWLALRLSKRQSLELTTDLSGLKGISFKKTGNFENDWNKKSEAFKERKEKLKDFLDRVDKRNRQKKPRQKRENQWSIDQNLALHLSNLMHSQMILGGKVINRSVFLERKWNFTFLPMSPLVIQMRKPKQELMWVDTGWWISRIYH